MQRNQQTIEQVLPLGLVATRQYLFSAGVDQHVLDNAVKFGKLISIYRGVYVRSGLPLTWEGVLSSLAMLYPETPVYVGGVSAVHVVGLGHYVQSLSEIHVYSQREKPHWLTALVLPVTFVWRRNKKLWCDINNDMLLTSKWREDVPGYYMSSTEQACLEFLDDVPQRVSFEYADVLFQGLTALSPSKLDAFLKQCRSVKAKRLFFWFAERHGFQWSKIINKADYDLGSGKRVIAEQGRLDKDLMITVPNSL